MTAVGARTRAVRRALAAALVVPALLAACSSGGHAATGSGTAPPSTSRGLQGSTIDPPAAKPHFTLTDTSGKPYDFASRTAGKLTVLYFGYTHCPDICQINMNKLAAVEARKGVPKATVVFVTVDPERDTPKVLRAWLDHFNSDFVGLTGTPAAVDHAQEASNVPVATKQPGTVPGEYLMSHTGVVTVFAPNGRNYTDYETGTSLDTYQHDLTLLAHRT